jgi:hypothetical protein
MLAVLLPLFLLGSYPPRRNSGRRKRVAAARHRVTGELRSGRFGLRHGLSGDHVLEGGGRLTRVNGSTRAVAIIDA